MRSRTKDFWGPSFCAILLLCLCIEGLQTAADIFVVCDAEKSRRDGVASQYNRGESFMACQALDEFPFEKTKKLFHDIYRSHKESNGGAREGGFNPLRSFQAGVDTGLDRGTLELVKSINWIIWDSCKFSQRAQISPADDVDNELEELSMKPPIVNPGFPVKPREIKHNNTGRLIAKFLLSFLSTQN